MGGLFSAPKPKIVAAPQPAAETKLSAAADQSLAEMAQRLEAALRKPRAQQDERHRRDRGQPHDEGGVEPILLAALLQDDLQRAPPSKASRATSKGTGGFHALVGGTN